MMILTITALCIFIGYIVYLLNRFGIIPSISDSYYLLEQKEKGTGLYFTIWCALITTFILPPSMDVCNTWWQSLIATLMCVGLIFVGASPAFKRDNHRPYHLTGAILAAGCAVTLSLVWGCWYIVIPSTIICLIVQFCTSKKDITLWLEIACFLAYFISLVLRTF